MQEFYYSKTPHIAVLETEEVALIWPDVAIIVPNIYALMGLGQYLALAAYNMRFMPRIDMGITLDELLEKETPVPDVFRKAFEGEDNA